MKIKEIKLHQLLRTMKNPFTTSFGTQQKRFITIVEAIDEDGVSGFGECVSGEDPLYSEEFMDATLIALKKYFGPLVINKDRKSTRLNSSHVSISYAVSCLKNNK